MVNGPLVGLREDTGVGKMSGATVWVIDAGGTAVGTAALAIGEQATSKVYSESWSKIFLKRTNGSLP
jgi:hypothetical protein